MDNTVPGDGLSSITSDKETLRIKRVTQVINIRVDRIMELIKNPELIRFADGVLDRLKKDLVMVSKNQYGYNNINVKYTVDGEEKSHGGLPLYKAPWKNTDTIYPIINMALSNNPGKKITITSIDCIEGAPPSWVKRK